MEREFRYANDAAQEWAQDVKSPPCSAADKRACGGMNTDTSTQEMLLNMVGRYVVCELLIALNTFYIREGILLQVAQNFFLLLDESTNARVACDLHALKFMTVFPAGVRPGVMSQEEKCSYLGQLKANQNCRMQALPPAQGEGMAQGLPMTPFYGNPAPNGNTPVMLYDPFL